MKYAIGERFVFDQPENHCFGCSPHNPRGLQIEFVRSGERTIETTHEVDEALAGWGGVVHGGVQAALLDEVMGVAAHTGVPEGEQWNFATAEMNLRYRRPVPTARPLRVRGELVRAQGRDFYVEGAIVGPDEEVLTSARSRWRRLEGSLA